jgi:hypothetical protein
MKFLKRIICSIIVLFLIFSCDNDDSNQEIEYPTELIRDYSIQYNEDILKIEEFLKTHSITIIDHPGFADDQDVIFESVSSLDINSIWGSDVNLPKPTLLSKLVNYEGVTHKVYFLKLREGIGMSPNNNNQIKAYYKGFLLDNTVFNESIETGDTYKLNELIIGWREILPEFKMGTTTGVDQYEDFGAGVMFLPSALGYYQHSVGQIPAYSPIIFNFKLFNVF